MTWAEETPISPLATQTFSASTIIHDETFRRADQMIENTHAKKVSRSLTQETQTTVSAFFFFYRCLRSCRRRLICYVIKTTLDWGHLQLTGSSMKTVLDPNKVPARRSSRRKPPHSELRSMFQINKRKKKKFFFWHLLSFFIIVILHIQSFLRSKQLKSFIPLSLVINGGT